MNAATPKSREVEDEVLALQNKALLRLLAQGVDDDIAPGVLAARLDRDPSNLRKTLTKLQERGMVTEGLQLTEAGAHWKRRLDAFDALQPVDAGTLSAAPDRFRANPNNLRKTINLDDIEGLADSYGGEEADAKVLQPLVVTPPNSDGVMTILIGERRWRAMNARVARGADPATCQLPYRVLEGFDPEDAAGAALLALIENGQRAGLNKIEEARGFIVAMEAYGWSARRLASEIGKRGDAGAKYVQEAVKVLREAPAELIAAYEAGGETAPIWKDLVRAVTESKPALPEPADAQLALFLVEAATLGDMTEGVWDAPLPIRSQGQWPLSWQAGWFVFVGDAGDFQLTQQATDWLARVGLGDDPALVFNRFRLAAGHPAVARPGPPFASPELQSFNPVQSAAPTYTPPPPRAAPAPLPPRSPAPAPTQPQAMRGLKPMEMLAFLELVAAQDGDGWVELDGRTGRFVPVHNDWTEATAIALQQELGLITIVPRPQGRFAGLTEKGQAYAAEHAAHKTVADKLLAQRHVQNLPAPPQGQWSTAWLNVPPAEEGGEEAEGEAEEVQKAAELAGQALAIMEDLMSPAGVGEAEAGKVAAQIRDLLKSAGLAGPFTVSDEPSETGCLFDEANNTVVATIDVNRDLPEDIAAARTALLGAALNLALSLAGEPADA